MQKLCVQTNTIFHRHSDVLALFQASIIMHGTQVLSAGCTYLFLGEDAWFSE